MQQLTSVQVLRAVAATAVAVAHLQVTLAQLNAPSLPDGFVIGAAGVDLFFVISGFVIVYSSERLFGRPLAPAYFFARRLIRIAPLYYASTTALLAFLVWRFSGDLREADLTIASVIASYLFLPFVRPSGSAAPLLGAGWTLIYEMFFYALFAGFVWLPRIRATIGAILVLCFMFALGRLHLVPDPYSRLADPLILEFVYGAIIGLAYRRGMRLLPRTSIALIVTASAVVVYTAIYGLGTLQRFYAWGLPSAAILAAMILTNSKMRDGAINRGMVLLGDASYSLYLTHYFTLLVGARVLPNVIDPVASPWLFGLVLMGFCIAVALAVFLLAERPTTRFLQRHLHARLFATPSAALARCNSERATAGAMTGTLFDRASVRPEVRTRESRP